MREYKRFTIKNSDGTYSQPTDLTFEKTFYRLAELEDKIENGTLIELPCKVGDTVYLLGGVCSIVCLTVTHIILDTKKSYIRTDFETDSEDYWGKYKGGQYDFSDFGKIIFTNKAEAEQKLKEKGEV